MAAMQILAFSTITNSLPCSASASYGRRQSISAIANRQSKFLQHQITHSMPPEKVELFKLLEPWASENVLPLLKPVEKCWQPIDFFIDPVKPVNDFMDEVRALRERTDELPDEYFVVLVGDMITEDVLPTYQTMMNTLDGVRDETGASPSPWASWVRAWTAEENRHGDLLRTYLYLSGRVNMLMIERTLQYLIGAGMGHGLESNPYLGFVYTSFQERATFVTHYNMTRLAKECGDPVLAKICGTITTDEKRHENAYIKIVKKLLEIDPNEIMMAVAKMLRKRMKMPGHLMYDGQNPHLFDHHASLVQRLGIYTIGDYADILEFLIGRWKIEKLEGLNSDGKNGQEFVCNLTSRIRKLQVLVDETNKEVKFQDQKFSWIFNKEVAI